MRMLRTQIVGRGGLNVGRPDNDQQTNRVSQRVLVRCGKEYETWPPDSGGA